MKEETKAYPQTSPIIPINLGSVEKKGGENFLN